MSSEQIFKLDNSFIMENMDDLIELVDYVPFSFADYNAQEERDEFLKSKNLLATIQEMDQLITAKIGYYEDPVKAYNSLIIEWINYHQEFEGIISEESFDNYMIMINKEDFIDLLLDVKLPSEKKVWEPPKNRSSLRNDSSIQLPDFKKVDTIYEKYGASLLSCYLSYVA